jgi:thiamine-monophosphate kinase
LNHIARESGVGAEIMADAIPVSEDAKQYAKANGKTPLEHALNDGEDFELLLAVEPVDAQDLLKQNPLKSVKLTHIGRIVEGSGVTMVQPDGKRSTVKPGGYEHFK